MMFTYKQSPDANCNLRKLLAQVDHNLKKRISKTRKIIIRIERLVVNAESRHIAIRLKLINYD